jgi:hypothetical protein
LQLSSTWLPAISIAPGLMVSGAVPHSPGLSQQSPSETSHPSASQSCSVLSHGTQSPDTQSS